MKNLAENAELQEREENDEENSLSQVKLLKNQSLSELRSVKIGRKIHEVDNMIDISQGTDLRIKEIKEQLAKLTRLLSLFTELTSLFFMCHVSTQF